ncbi:hypothetical protein ACJX0J_009160, partial [Zea mays]
IAQDNRLLSQIKYLKEGDKKWNFISELKILFVSCGRSIALWRGINKKHILSPFGMGHLTPGPEDTIFADWWGKCHYFGSMIRQPLASYLYGGVFSVILLSTCSLAELV